jgi:hypothetical protein
LKIFSIPTTSIPKKNPTNHFKLLEHNLEQQICALKKKTRFSSNVCFYNCK